MRGLQLLDFARCGAKPSPVSLSVKVPGGRRTEGARCAVRQQRRFVDALLVDELRQKLDCLRKGEPIGDSPASTTSILVKMSFNLPMTPHGLIRSTPHGLMHWTPFARLAGCSRRWVHDAIDGILDGLLGRATRRSAARCMSSERRRVWHSNNVGGWNCSGNQVSQFYMARDCPFAFPVRVGVGQSRVVNVHWKIRLCESWMPRAVNS